MLIFLLLLPLIIASPLLTREKEGKREISRRCFVTLQSTTSIGPVTIDGLAFPQFGQDVFLGIPFAQPPVGNLRFAPPQPPKYNASTFSAKKQPPACLQNPNGTSIGEYGSSEDCLYLNVFTPLGSAEAKAKLPVMIWVYGGNFVSGAASTYNATAIVAQSIQSEKPVIVVTINYRLGIFGFGYGKEIATNGAANLGLRDLIAAKGWVRQNIQAFGGDPSQITLFGQSAGAVLISLLYLRPDISSFKSAIMQSGAQSVAPIGPTSTTWQTAFEALVQAVNCNGTSGGKSSFECLKALPADALLKGQIATTSLPIFSAGFVFAPSIDGDLILASPHDLLAQGKFAKIPFISGSVLDEGTLFVPPTINSTEAIGQYINVVEPRIVNTSVLEKLLKLYPDDPTQGSPFNTGSQTFGISPQYKRTAAIAGDVTFQSSRRWFLEQANAFNLSQTWSYLFTEYTPGATPYLGSSHGSDVPFVFGRPSTATNFTEAAVTLSKTMIDYWLNFAYYTDPSGGKSNSTKWPKYGSDKTMLQLNGTNTTSIKDVYRQEQIGFFLGEPQAFNLR